MKKKGKILLVFTILMMLVLVISSACDVAKPGKEKEAQELLDEMFPESNGDSSAVAGEGETGAGSDGERQPGKVGKQKPAGGMGKKMSQKRKYLL